MNYIPYKDFIDGKYDSTISDLKESGAIDEDSINFWLNRSFYKQMMDIWGEVNRLKTINNEDLENQLLRIHNYLTLVRESDNNNFDEKVKKTFRIAEWELYDFFLWKNEFGNRIDTVTLWFDQWCFNINYELL